MIPVQGKYTNAIIYTDNVEQKAISQIFGLCNHPAFENATIRIMPDVHYGEGCTVGTTVKLAKKMVIPNIVGVDIGCGVRTTIFKTKMSIDFKELDDFIVNKIPSGMAIHEHTHLDLNKDVKTKIKEVVKDLNLGNEEKYLHSVGSLGGGNHYIEIGRIDDETYALSIHSGSRNLGKKVCEIFQIRAKVHMEGGKRLKAAQKELVERLKKEHREKDISKEFINLKNNFDGKITGIPLGMEYIEDEDFDDYIVNMMKCQELAKESRRLMSKDIIEFLGVEVIDEFDTIHNYIEQVQETLDETTKMVYYIRKGAISAKEGEKVAIPLNMKDGVIIGVGKGNKEWNYSAPHGAGRLLSRGDAKELISLEEYKAAMENVQTWSVCTETIDESPQAYKPANEIIELVKDTIDIQYIVKPIYNFKAHAEKKSWKEIKAEEKLAKKLKRENICE